MNPFKIPMVAAALGLAALGLSASTVSAQSSSVVPVDVWALRTVVSNVQLSPDGKHLLVLSRKTKEGDNFLQVYKTDDLSKPLRTLAADPTEFISARWVSDNYIFGSSWEVKRKRVRRPEDDVREYTSYSYNLEKNKFSKLDENLSVVSTLPNEPNHILVDNSRIVSQDPQGTDPFEEFRPRVYYKLDLRSGSKKFIIKGNQTSRNYQFDINGNPRFKASFNLDTNEVTYYHRKPGESNWIKHVDVFDQDEHENLYRFLGGPFGVRGWDPDRPNIVYMLENRGSDKSALWEYDVDKGEFVKKLFEAPEADVMGIQSHSIPGNDKLVAAIYPGAKYERHWFDEEEKALFEALEQQIPYAHQLSISSRSRDGKTMVVNNSGPHDPGSYWLVKDGKMAKLGSRNPLINPDQLSDVKYIRYKARDGLVIPAYLTLPKGEGPFPLVVQHNGGPHVNAVQGYSEMSQMLANAGYAVLYPQNRISTGWGKKHFDAGYGQHGLAMQDDKDDGVKYLIEKGIVDPDRVAFFGWSYGGYAALVATSREEQLYQCAIAVAAVADPEKSYFERRSPYSPKALDDWGERRGKIGINPINEVEKVNIPLLMVHGDVDRRVRYYHFKDYKKAMERAGKSSMAQYLTLKGADHFSNTLMFNHKKTLYTKMLDYLANDCGPGGL